MLTNEQKMINEERLRKFGPRKMINTTGLSYYTRSLLSNSTITNTNRENRILVGEVIVPGIDGKVFTICCNKCRKWGHYANKYPEAESDNVSRIDNEIQDFLTNDDYALDSGGMHLTLKSDKDVEEIEKLPDGEELLCQTKSRKIIFNKKGKLKIFDQLECYINKLSRANILALDQLNHLPGAFVEYRGDIEDAFYLRYKCG